MGDQSKVLDEAIRETLPAGKHDHLPTDSIDSSSNIPPTSVPLAEDEDLNATSDQPSIVTSSKPLQSTVESPHTTDTTGDGNLGQFSDTNSQGEQTTAIAVELQSRPTHSNGDTDVKVSSGIPTQESEAPVSDVLMPSSVAQSALATDRCQLGDTDDTNQEIVQTTTSQSTHTQPPTSMGTKIPQPMSRKTDVSAQKPIQETDLPANQSDQSTKPANLTQRNIESNQQEVSDALITPNPQQQQPKEQSKQQQQMVRKQDDQTRDAIQPPRARSPKPQNKSPTTQPVTPAKPPANQPANQTNKTKTEANQSATRSDQTAHQANPQPLPSDKSADDKTPEQKTSATSKESSADSPKVHFQLEKSQSDITLFCFYNSYYSQRALLCLYEREIDFKVRLLNTFADENLEPWYMVLNPKAEVPMLKVGEHYITESEAIINYLGRLPMSKGTTLVGDSRTPSGQLIQRFRRLIDGVNMVLLTYGLVHHPHLSKGKINMPAFIQRMMKVRMPAKTTTLSKLAEKYPDHRNSYLALIETNAERCEAFKDVETVSKEVDNVGQILASLEEQLSKTKPGNEDCEWWLCGDEFSAADISMIILINRLHLLGLNYHYFGDKLPLVQQYFKRASQRPSYKSLTLMAKSGRTAMFKEIIMYSTKQALPYVGGATVLGVAAGLAFWMYKKVG